MESIEFNTRDDFFEIDFEYERVGWFNLKAQVGRIDNEELSWDDDLDYLTLIEFQAIPEIPYLRTVIPYTGFSTREQMNEHNSIFGLNIKPLDDVYLKLEYNLDSQTGVKDKIDFQFGYLF